MDKVQKADPGSMDRVQETVRGTGSGKRFQETVPRTGSRNRVLETSPETMDHLKYGPFWLYNGHFGTITVILDIFLDQNDRLFLLET